MKIKNTFDEFRLSFIDDAGFFISFLGGFCSKLTALGISLFGNLLIIANEKKTGDDDYENNAKTKIQLIFLIGNILQVPCCLGVGYLSDKIKVWYLMVILSAIVILSLIVMLIFLEHNDAPLYLGFSCVYIFHGIVYMLVIFLLFIIIVINIPK